ncbi:MAG: cell division topological specificity factor MinE [Synergistaceae bacterium]|nr:cell division topological specificity factor MinE [Synergistaceae bacterium]
MMFEFLHSLFGRENSSQVAKERLQLVLIHDRNDISPEILNSLKIDMIKVIKKYLEIDEGNIEIELERENRSVALVASIPLKNMQRPVRGKKRNG